MPGFKAIYAYGSNNTCHRCNWGYFLDVAINGTIVPYTDTGHICRHNCFNNPTGYYDVLAMNRSKYQGVAQSTQFGDHWTKPDEPFCYLCHAHCTKCYNYTVNDCTSCIDGYYLDGSTCKKCGAKCATCYDVNTVTGIIVDINNVAITGSANYGGNDTCSRCNWGYFLDVAINTTYPSVLDTGRTCLPDCTVN
jgi:hypothetical protein